MSRQHAQDACVIVAVVDPKIDQLLGLEYPHYSQAKSDQSVQGSLSDEGQSGREVAQVASEIRNCVLCLSRDFERLFVYLDLQLECFVELVLLDCVACLTADLNEDRGKAKERSDERSATGDHCWP